MDGGVTTGGNNVGVGVYVLDYHGGDDNVAIGTNAGGSLTTVNGNVL